MNATALSVLSVVAGLLAGCLGSMAISSRPVDQFRLTVVAAVLIVTVTAIVAVAVA
jgi:hypothetical protein